MPLRAYAELHDAALARIAQRRDQVAADTAAYFQPAGDVLPQRNFYLIAEILCGAAPEAPLASLQLSARFCMWMYLLDYYVDEVQMADAQEVQRIHESVQRVLDGREVQSAHYPFLIESLCELMQAYGALPLRADSLSAFKQQVCDELHADQQLIQLSESAAPDPRIFLTSATTGVNHISCSLSLLYAAWPDVSAQASHALQPALRRAARAVRFSNDLRTHAKDDAEGLLHCLRFWSPETLRAAIPRHLERMDQRLDHFVTAGGPVPAAAALSRLARIGVEVYGFTDIRYDEATLRQAARLR